MAVAATTEPDPAEPPCPAAGSAIGTIDWDADSADWHDEIPAPPPITSDAGADDAWGTDDDADEPVGIGEDGTDDEEDGLDEGLDIAAYHRLYEDHDRIVAAIMAYHPPDDYHDVAENLSRRTYRVADRLSGDDARRDAVISA